MTTETIRAGWTTAAILVGRLIFASVFIMAASFKLMDINGTAGYIASAGFPLPNLLAWLAALLELALIACFLTGAYFSEAALLAAAYVLFLAFAFHGPSHWAGKPGRVRVLRRSFHIYCRPSLCGCARPRTRLGNETWMDYAAIIPERPFVMTCLRPFRHPWPDPGADHHEEGSERAAVGKIELAIGRRDVERRLHPLLWETVRASPLSCLQPVVSFEQAQRFADNLVLRSIEAALDLRLDPAG